MSHMGRVMPAVRTPLGVLAAAALVGALGAVWPLVWLATGVAVLAAAGMAAAARWPEQALRIAPLLALIAGTKFRYRDPSASLSAELDAQVVAELGLFAAVAAIVCCSRFARPRPPARRPAVLLALGAYVATALASALWSAAPTLTVVRAGQLAILLALALEMVDVLGAERALVGLAQAVLAYVAAFAALAAVFPFARRSEGQDDPGAGWRFSWFDVHPITASTLAALAVLLSVLWLLRPARPDHADVARRRVAAAVVLVAGLGVILFAKSRGPLGALLATLALLAARRYARAWVVAGGAAAAVVAAVLFAYYFDAQEVLARATESGGVLAMISRGQSAEQLAGFSGRSDLWADLVPVFLDSPGYGYGYQGSRALLLAIMPWATYAHNALGQTLLDLGVLGTIPLWAAVARTLWLSARPGGPHGAWAREVVFAGTAFLLLNSITSESFAGAPGYEVLLLFVLVQTGALAHAPLELTALAPARLPGRWAAPTFAYGGRRAR